VPRGKPLGDRPYQLLHERFAQIAQGRGESVEVETWVEDAPHFHEQGLFVAEVAHGLGPALGRRGGEAQAQVRRQLGAGAGRARAPTGQEGQQAREAVAQDVFPQERARAQEVRQSRSPSGVAKAARLSWGRSRARSRNWSK
jgi:hypothetical protein